VGRRKRGGGRGLEEKGLVERGEERRRRGGRQVRRVRWLDLLLLG